MKILELLLRGALAGWIGSHIRSLFGRGNDDKGKVNDDSHMYREHLKDIMIGYPVLLAICFLLAYVVYLLDVL